MIPPTTGRFPFVALAASLSIVCGCGGAPATREPEEPRRVGSLPPLPTLTRPPAQLATALDAADALLSEVPPAAPADASVEVMSEWLVATYLPWTSAWLERIPGVADPLAAASALDPDLRVFSSSIVALLFEIARARVLELPVPPEVAADPAARADWAALLGEATSPAAAEASALLAACVELAGDRLDAAAWRDDCAARLAALPAPAPAE